MLRPVQLDPALIGHPLPWDVFNAAGVLVAGAGLLVADEVQFNRLNARALYREGETTTATETPLARLVVLAKQAETTLKNPTAATLRTLVQSLLDVQRADVDACLGYASLVPLARPSVAHAIRVLFVVQLLAEKLEFSEAEQESLAAAALTMNIASLDLHDRLHACAGAVPENERAALRKHPESSAERLQQVGVTDALWLDAVRQHHENMDGSGYLHGLAGGGISLSARLLRVADFYCAKVSGRYYRAPKAPSFAFQELFGREKSRLDNQFAIQLLRRMGLYQPGMLVRLASREIACIARRSPGGTPRWAVSVLDARERLLEPPQTRDLNTRQHAIIGSADRESHWPEINWMAVWGY